MEIKAKAFYECRALSSVSFQKGSSLARIGDSCFCYTEIKEFRAPRSLRDLGQRTF